MKRLILFLFVILALTVSAYSTDVTVSSVVIDGFSPANIGSDRPIAVSASNGSPTVTSSGQFTGIVGIGGFQVLIDGTQYAVASVESTSSLTLTANYTGTPGAQVMTLYKWVEMRVYADRAFQPLGDTQIVQPGTVGSGNFFRRFAASIVNNGSTDQLFIPEIILPATTDALITNQAKYSFPLYRPGTTSQLTFFFCPSSLAQLRLAPATPTTWTAICSFNSPPAVVPPANEAYTKAQIDARLPSCTLNKGVYYSAAGNILSCLTFGNGLTLTGGTLEASAGGSGYNRIQEEGSNLTQRAIFNFVGTSFTAADDAGNTRTNISADTDLNALASNGTNGFWARTGAGTGSARTLTGTANEIAIANGDGSGVPTFSLPAALTFTGKTVTGGTFATPTITTPTITGGTHTALTGLGIRSTGSGAFDLTLRNTENLTAGRNLTLTLNNADRTLNLGGNLTTGGAFSTTGTFISGGNFSTGSTFSTSGTFATNGNFSTGSTFSTTGTFSSGGNFSTGAAFTTTPANALTLTTSGATNVTLPTTGTLANNNNNLSFFSSTTSAQLAGVISDETGSGSLVFGTSPRFTTSINDSAGNTFFTLSPATSAVNGFTLANAATGNAPSITASGNDSNINLNLRAKGTGRVSIPGYPYTLEVNTTATGNVTTGLDSLHTYTLPANSLAANGDRVKVEYSGTFATNDNDKRIVVSFGGQTTTAIGTGLFDVDSGRWRYDITYTRVSATTVRVSVAFMWSTLTRDGAGTITGTVVHAPDSGLLTVADLAANTMVLLVQAEGTATDDIIQNMSSVEVIQR